MNDMNDMSDEKGFRGGPRLDGEQVMALAKDLKERLRGKTKIECRLVNCGTPEAVAKCFTEWYVEWRQRVATINVPEVYLDNVSSQAIASVIRTLQNHEMSECAIIIGPRLSERTIKQFVSELGKTFAPPVLRFEEKYLPFINEILLKNHYQIMQRSFLDSNIEDGYVVAVRTVAKKLDAKQADIKRKDTSKEIEKLYAEQTHRDSILVVKNINEATARRIAEFVAPRKDIKEVHIQGKTTDLTIYFFFRVLALAVMKGTFAPKKITVSAEYLKMSIEALMQSEMITFHANPPDCGWVTIDRIARMASLTRQAREKTKSIPDTDEDKEEDIVDVPPPSTPKLARAVGWVERSEAQQHSTPKLASSGQFMKGILSRTVSFNPTVQVTLTIKKRCRSETELLKVAPKLARVEAEQGALQTIKRNFT